MRYEIYQMDKEHTTYLVENEPDIYFNISRGNITPVDFLAHYQLVAEIEANDLNEVFNIGNNVGPEEKITRIARMHSISVGDVIRDDTNKLFVVKPIGFERFHASATEVA